MRRSLPRLEQIEAFVQAANAPSFRVAAERCALSPAALSRRIQAISDHFGYQLFERTAGGARLTEVGRQCLDELEPAYIELQHAASRIGVNASRTINLSLSHSLAVGWLIPRLPDFHRAHPDIEIALKVDRTASLIRRGDADMGLCMSDIDVTGLAHEKLLPVRAVPVASPALAASLEGGGLAGQNLLCTTTPGGERWSFWTEVADGAYVDGPILRFEIMQAMYEAAAQGLGVALGASPTVWPYIDSGRLVRLDFPVVAFPGFYSVVAKPERRRNHAVARIWSWLETQAAATPVLN